MSNRVRATLPVSSTVIGVALSAAFMAVACGPGEARGTDGPGGEGKGGANRVPTVAKRIIAIAPNAAETICALGACDRIVGVSKYCVYPPELKLTPALEERLRSQWRSLGAIPAVGSGRIYFLGDDHSLIPSVRYPAIIEKVSRMLHPDGLSDP